MPDSTRRPFVAMPVHYAV